MYLQSKYQPKDLKQLVGNDHIREALRSNFEKSDPTRTFLLTGESGTGKSTVAQIIKEMVKCDDLAFMEVNASIDRGIANIRSIRETLNYRPIKGNVKVVLWEECHGLSADSWEGLLQITENPSDNLFFIFCTSEPGKIKATTKRRLFQLEMKLVDNDLMMKYLSFVLKKEGVEQLHSSILKCIVDKAGGSLGFALNYLERVMHQPDPKKAFDLLQEVQEENPEAIEICRALVKKDWGAVTKVLSGFTGNPESARHIVLAYFKKILLSRKTAQTAFREAQVMSCFINSYKESGLSGLILSCHAACLLGGE